MNDKQEVKIIVDNSDAFAYLLAVLCTFKPKDEAEKFAAIKSGWYSITSEGGTKPVKLKAQMSFQEFMFMIFATGAKGLETKVFCENGVFVLR